MIRLILLELVEHILLLGIAMKLLLAAVDASLPNVETDIKAKNPYVKVLDRNGETIAEYGDYYEDEIKLDQLPKYLIHGLVDTEDRRFFQHRGLDVIGVIRALYTNFTSRRVRQGGSSITQQLAKDMLIRHGMFTVYDQSLPRKLHELTLARQLERRYSKAEILELYINRVYFGSGAYGIGAAARRFFNKKPGELNVYEAARLVGMVQAPSRYAVDQSQANVRTMQVIDNMILHNHIKPEEREIALLLATDVNKRQGKNEYYFADWITSIAARYYKASNEASRPSFTVYTTLDPKWQKVAQDQAAEMMSGWGAECKAEYVGAIACDYSGAIRALVGGVDYNKSQFNQATSAHRQVGSLFKVIVYLAAIEAGLEPDSLLVDEPIEFGEWAPGNVTNDFKGEVSAETAFAKSINTVAVKLCYEVGVGSVIRMARRLGIDAALPYNLSIALGTGEASLFQMMSPFLTLANQGFFTKPFAIEKIIDNNTAQVLYQRSDPKPRQILNNRTVDHMNQLLLACCEYGSGRRAKFEAGIGGKTGSSQNYRDQWMIGYSEKTVTGVLFSTNKAGMDRQAGKPIHVELWRRIAQGIHSIKQVEIDQLKPEQIATDESIQGMKESQLKELVLQDEIQQDRSSSSESDQATIVVNSTKIEERSTKDGAINSEEASGSEASGITATAGDIAANTNTRQVNTGLDDKSEAVVPGAITDTVTQKTDSKKDNKSNRGKRSSKKAKKASTNKDSDSARPSSSEQ